jgi:hypothetical protein
LLQDDKSYCWEEVELNNLTVQEKRNELVKLQADLEKMKKNYWPDTAGLLAAITTIEKQLAQLQVDNLRLLKQYDEMFYKVNVLEKERSIAQRKKQIVEGEMENLNNFVKEQARIADEDEKSTNRNDRPILAPSNIYHLFSLFGMSQDTKEAEVRKDQQQLPSTQQSSSCKK